MSPTTVAVLALVVSVLTAVLAWWQTNRLGQSTEKLGREANDVRRRLLELEEARGERERKRDELDAAGQLEARVVGQYSPQTRRVVVTNKGPATARAVSVRVPSGRPGESLPQLTGDTTAAELPTGGQLEATVKWSGDRPEWVAEVRWTSPTSEDCVTKVRLPRPPKPPAPRRIR